MSERVSVILLVLVLCAVTTAVLLAADRWGLAAGALAFAVAVVIYARVIRAVVTRSARPPHGVSDRSADA